MTAGCHCSAHIGLRKHESILTLLMCTPQSLLLTVNAFFSHCPPIPLQTTDVLLIFKNFPNIFHYLAPENEQPDYPFVYVGWNVDCELSEEDEDSGQDNEKITENMSWDRDRCDH